MLPENDEYNQFTQKHQLLESGKVRHTWTLKKKKKEKRMTQTNLLNELIVNLVNQFNKFSDQITFDLIEHLTEHLSTIKERYFSTLRVHYKNICRTTYRIWTLVNG